MKRSLLLSSTLLSAILPIVTGIGSVHAEDTLPLRLHDTGLYGANTAMPRGDLHGFTPQYPL
ncbi:MAG: hypothetical protein ACKVQU_29145 [Burkholderiales bacterium]